MLGFLIWAVTSMAVEEVDAFIYSPHGIVVDLRMLNFPCTWDKSGRSCPPPCWLSPRSSSRISGAVISFDGARSSPWVFNYEALFHKLTSMISKILRTPRKVFKSMDVYVKHCI